MLEYNTEVSEREAEGYLPNKILSISTLPPAHSTLRCLMDKLDAAVPSYAKILSKASILAAMRSPSERLMA